MFLFLGIDGGHTHSVSALSDEEGRLLGLGQGGPIGWMGKPADKVLMAETLTDIIHKAYAEAQLEIADSPRAVACGLSQGKEKAKPIVRGILKMQNLDVFDGYVCAQAGAFAGGPGIVVVGATGSVAYGEDRTGNTARAGGWGYVMGDDGGSYDIGHQALRAAARASDGRGPKTLLAERIPVRLELPTLEAVCDALQAQQIAPERVADLAMLVADLAWEGDAIAASILETAGAALAQAAVAVARALSWSDPVVSPVGGVFRAGKVLMGPFTRRLNEAFPEAVIRPPHFPPVFGALLMALSHYHPIFPAAVLEHLEQGAARLSEDTDDVAEHKD